MPATPEELFEKLDALGITYETHHHAPVFTVDEAQAHTDHLPGGHCKNLFLKDKTGDLYLVVCLQDTAVDLKAFRKLVGARNLSFGKPELLWEVLGVEPGSVTPFSLINDTDRLVMVILEKRMMAHDLLNYHPLRNTMTTQITSSDLEKFIEGCGHQPRILDLPERT
ncbi:prolyl-tRNA synthetase associated domain-containing protein [Sneathiella sp. CAU 1612]|jgi:Ala-tRNA(Pro) deacylase|uniref:Prolyl-tRNA synthetase associated domain-containing protein n=1 Tax=Sneathiella sedimenti TaxID=2816034 RepID=A0ABS3F325_9PROT|nr:prolyl-tRNA synthetase associated domain-containing protein [Sneathiella sedimenti]MBO0332501.1 prolyl-tRNA synthetase associated domain-containing protein [Sneathiella sedimenti]